MKTIKFGQREPRNQTNYQHIFFFFCINDLGSCVSNPLGVFGFSYVIQVTLRFLMEVGIFVFLPQGGMAFLISSLGNT